MQAVTNLQKITIGILILSLIYTCNTAVQNQSGNDLSNYPYQPQFKTPLQPKGFPKMHVPADNQQSEAGIDLGRHLFYDPILSVDSSQSCASCHKIEYAFTDHAAFSKGVDQQFGKRSSMSLLNIGYNQNGLFWDGRAKDLEAQALVPVEDPIEMHNTWPNVVEKLIAHPNYPYKFRAAFGIKSKQEIDKTLVTKALAQFERSLISADSKYDRVMAKEDKFTESEQLGWDMFFDVSEGIPDAECAHCHNEPFFTVNDYFNNGIEKVASIHDFKDEGRANATQQKYDKGKFRAPTLRNIEHTAPYMHDGRFKSLEEVIEHYNSGVQYAENVSPLLRKLDLSNLQKTALIDFLKTLTDSTYVKNSRYTNPFQ